MRRPMSSGLRAVLNAVAVLCLSTVVARADVDLVTKFTNVGSVANTRHNLTQRPPQNPNGLFGGLMNPYRNDYGEVCVYCHTPHGANTTISAPLWNRTNAATSYQIYNLLGSQASGNTVNQPGASSLTCLSCHDGTVAIDSVINMPGSGRYSISQQSAQNDGFLNAQWNNAVDSNGGGGPDATVHMNLTGCMACHAPGTLVGVGATDFSAFNLGTDLRNDHPVGIKYPSTGPGVDFNPTTASVNTVRFFDSNGNGRPDKNEIRLYAANGDYQVECASCHDPHGVGPGPGGNGSPFNPTFLRLSNAGSAVCLTCHVK